MVLFLSNFRMSPRLFSSDTEPMLLKQYEDVWVKASGSTLRVAEKYAVIGTRMKFSMTFQQMGQDVCSRTSSRSLLERRAASVL